MIARPRGRALATQAAWHWLVLVVVLSFLHHHELPSRQRWMPSDWTTGECTDTPFPTRPSYPRNERCSHDRNEPTCGSGRRSVEEVQGGTKQTGQRRVRCKRHVGQRPTTRRGTSTVPRTGGNTPPKDTSVSSWMQKGRRMRQRHTPCRSPNKCWACTSLVAKMP